MTATARGARGPRLPPRLVALSPGDLRGGAALERFARAVDAALEAGLRGVVLREPALSDRDAFELARALRDLRDRREGAWFAVHDRLHVALAVGADAVHLGFRSLEPRVARAVAEGRLAVGFSAHAHDAEGAAEGADYLFLGPVLDTPSKRGLVPPIGLDGLGAALGRAHAPTWAIGGLDPEHARPVLEAGAAGLAVLSGLFGDADPAQRARDYLREIG